MTTATIEARMENPSMTIDGLLPALMNAHKAAMKTGLPAEIAYLVHLRASQINGCSMCTDMHARELQDAGASDAKIWGVAAWRESPHFSAAERAALALAECETRLADRSDAVPDEVYDEAARHFDTEQLGALIVEISLINVWNRINATIRQPVIQLPA